MPSQHDQNLRLAIETDMQMGTQIERVYGTACSIMPILKEVCLTPVTEQLAEELAFIPYPSTIFDDEDPIIGVVFGVDFKYYQPYGSAPYSSRFATHIDYLRSLGKKTDLTDIVDICVAHELGHAKQLIETRARLGVAGGSIEINRQTISEYRALPLAIPTTDAESFWDNNTGGYRTYLMNTGYTEESFEEKIQDNIKAYSQLPNERQADEFALQVMMEMHK